MICCPHCHLDSVTKRGQYTVKNEHSIVQRYACKVCKKRFSDQTGTLTYKEKKPGVTRVLFRLLCSGMSQRAAADALAVKRDTVANKVRRLGTECKQRLAASLVAKPVGPVVMFDEMESYEHSKCKPLSMAVAVEQGSRRVIAVEVASMPAKGHLAEKSRKKYGRRPDGRPAALKAMCEQIKLASPGLASLVSDQSPRYPAIVAAMFPGVPHTTHKGRRGCVVGQGELKSGAFDPLFSLNHTCAMFRDALKRLTRRTWATTKKLACLQQLMHVYAYFHNQALEVGRRHVSI